MNIAGLFNIVKNRNGEIWTDITGKWETFEQPIKSHLVEVLKMARSKKTDANALRLRATALQNVVKSKIEDKKIEHNVPQDFQGTAEQYVEQLIDRTINFFSEFNFEPNFRFINTLANRAKMNDAVGYVSSYFRLTDNANINEIESKIRSREFSNLCNDFKNFNFDKVINTRFKLYYGSQGTGKTTLACQEANGNVMVCHSAMLPSDLMEDFKFINGQPNFTPSALQNAIVEGKKIVLDEINLLPFESLRFLQSILDGKKEFTYKGNVIHIHEDFQIIGTMNLVVNGCVYSLPEPLVDRSAELREFKLTANNLIGAIL